ncbi:MAG: hypothetical protein IJE09_05900 [Oscillospiraceae bacterium]|nr:hypothetical protein [Oscillospiraceae bacterium]
MKKYTNNIKIIFAVSLLILLVFSADKVKASCFDALLLCGRMIIPSLFPFFVLSAFMTKLGLPASLGRIISPFFCRLYGISPAGASALVMGFVGGYPAGASYIADMEKEGLINTGEGERLIAFCNNSGPAFIIGVMGSSIFGSVKTGLELYAVHIVSALIAALFFRTNEYSNTVQPHRLDETKTAEAVVASIKQATNSIINVCAFVISFSVLLSLMDSGDVLSKLCGMFSSLTGQPPQFAKALFTGILELGSAAGCMSGLEAKPLNMALAAAILSWGGLSVHFQTLAVLSESKIKGSLHLAGRLLSATIAFILMYFVSLF